MTNESLLSGLRNEFLLLTKAVRQTRYLMNELYFVSFNNQTQLQTASVYLITNISQITINPFLLENQKIQKIQFLSKIYFYNGVFAYPTYGTVSTFVYETKFGHL